MEMFLSYNILYQTLIDPKPLRIRFDQTDGFIYLVSLNSDITNIFSHYFSKIKLDFCYSLAIEKRLTLHNV